MMRLLCLTDLHGDERHLRGILKHAGTVDLLLLGGDLTNFGTPNQAEELVDIARESCPQILAVAGNCDSPAIDDRLLAMGISLFGRGVMRQRTGFYGVSAMPPWMGTMYELSESEIATALAAGRALVSNAARHVIVSHPPPRDCQLDLTRRGEHVGSSALREEIEACQPALVVCGHIHEARGAEKIGATTVVNCGAACHGHYALITLNDQIECDLRSVEPAA
jgi:Icc-related predicted phosphoesterase